jgi:hypothetical protein
MKLPAAHASYGVSKRNCAEVRPAIFVVPEKLWPRQIILAASCKAFWRRRMINEKGGDSLYRKEIRVSISRVNL